MRILYFGTYNPDYSRNRVLLKGLRANGADVQECRVEPGFGWWLRLFRRYISTKPKFDVMIVGFPGQEVMLLARFLTRKPIIFDAFTSHYGGYILDRKKHPENGLYARYYRFLDRTPCRLADAVLLDTNAHIDFFVSEFGLARDKFHRIFVGTDSSVFSPRPVPADGKFLVHFHGHFIPLQGVDYIIRAAKMLESQGIRFQLIGRGQLYEQARALAGLLRVNNINWVDEVSYERLPEHIARADVCLGIFGNTPKTELVIPNKVYEAVAMAKPVITADTPAVRELFRDGENILLCRRMDPEDLARKIVRLRDDTPLRERLAQGGRALFQTRLTEAILGRELLDILKTLRK